MHGKGSQRQNGKTIHRVGEDICKYDWQNICLQNLQTDEPAGGAQYQETKQTIQSKNGQKTYIDISPKKTYRWPKGTWKDAQHC